MLLFIEIFDVDVKAEELTVAVLLLGAVFFLVVGGIKRVFVPGWAYTQLEERLARTEKALEKSEGKTEEVERRLRMMEIIALRGTHMAEDMADVLLRDENDRPNEPA